MVVLGWGYLIYTGNISTLWPLFGTGNQLLATIALAMSTTFLINMGKAKYAWITAVPMCFVGVTTVTAGVLSIKNIFWPLTSKPGMVFTGYLDSILMGIFIRVWCWWSSMRCGAGSPYSMVRRPGRGFWSSCYRGGRSEDGLLLESSLSNPILRTSIRVAPPRGIRTRRASQ